MVPYIQSSSDQSSQFRVLASIGSLRDVVKMENLATVTALQIQLIVILS